MKSAAIFSVLLLAPASGMTQQPRPPNPEKMKAVNDVFDKIKSVKLRHQDSINKKRKIEIEIGLRDKKTDELRIPVRAEEFENWPAGKRGAYQMAGGLTDKEVVERLARSPEVHDDYKQATKDYEQFKKEVAPLLKDAVRVTQEAWGIAPRRKSGPILSGVPVHKLPDGKPDPEYVQSDIGKRASWAPGIDWNTPAGRFGYTDLDGKVGLGPEAFEYPGRLAFTLWHEGRHYDELLVSGVDYRNQPAREVLLREREQPGGLKEIFGLSDEDITRHQELLAAERDRAAQWEDQMREGFDPFKIAHKDAFRGNIHLPQGASPRSWLSAGDEETLKEISERAARLREERRKLEDEKRRKDEAGLQSLEYLQGLANRACLIGWMDPTALDLARLVPGSAFYCENAPRIMNADDGCSYTVYGDILGQLCRREVLSPVRINETLEKYRPRLGPVEADSPGKREREREVEAARKQRDYLFQQVKLSWDWLRGKASKACADPASLADEDIPVFRTAYVRLRDNGPEFNVPAPENAANGLEGCPKDLLLRIIHNESWGLVISGATYRQTAAEIAASHGSTPGSDPDSGDDGERGRDRGGNRVGDGSGPSRDKAEKIGRGKWPR